MSAHGAAVRRLTAIVYRRLDRHAFEQAANGIELAAFFASRHHPGFFASRELEYAAATIAENLRGVTEPVRFVGIVPPQRVMHVFTELYDTGGHTRLAARWIDADRARQHSLVTTRVPSSGASDLELAIRRSGGTIIDLARGSDSLLSRAKNLASAASDVDLVVLHVHPDDVVPVLAFAASGERPPVVLVNHADHVFWLGTSIADLVLCFRRSGLVLAQGRRGIHPDRLVQVPLPLPHLARRMGIADAKDELAISSDNVVLLTIAKDYKFRSRTSPDFLELVSPVVEEFPNVKLLAIGPTPVDRWAEYNRITGGRVRALGVIAAPFLHRHAADIYLDSTPFCSMTSLLESAALGTPALAYTPGRTDESVVFSDIDSLDQGLQRADSPDAYRALLRRLITDRGLRERVGDQLAHRVQAAHFPPAWDVHLDTIYTSLARVRSAQGPHARTRLRYSDPASQSEVDRQLSEIEVSPHGSLASLELLADERAPRAGLSAGHSAAIWLLRIQRLISTRLRPSSVTRLTSQLAAAIHRTFVR